ncbi:FliH/SctL family protein [Cupriavidus sp. 30B13]|uniref:FliH/SctL family protein n=1 Tax=Cupriavidus sp. 30B13 TaxID=3384241 RepID=UPI003B9150FC
MNIDQESRVLKIAVLEEAPRALPRWPARAPVLAVQPTSMLEPAVATGGVQPMPASGAAKQTDRAPAADDAEARGYAVGLERGMNEGMAAARVQIAEAAGQAAAAAREEVVSAQTGERARIDAALAEHALLTHRVLEQVQRKLDDSLHGMEAQAAAIAYEATCRIVGAAAPEPEAIRHVIVAAFAELQGKAVLRVRLHPDDFTTFHAGHDSSSLTARYPAVTWAADEGVAIGGCLVDTVAGTLDARIETQLQKLGRAWREAAATVPADSDRDGD